MRPFALGMLPELKNQLPRVVFAEDREMVQARSAGNRFLNPHFFSRFAISPDPQHAENR